jgi:hypothetical protein
VYHLIVVHRESPDVVEKAFDAQIGSLLKGHIQLATVVSTVSRAPPMLLPWMARLKYTTARQT